jgi:hypothetical protein
MERADITFWLSLWGSATSSILALMKGWEFYRAHRHTLVAHRRLNSDPERGNEIVILNKSDVPVTIAYFDLAWTERRKVLGVPVPFTRRVVSTDSPIDGSEGYDAHVPPHTTHILGFRDEYHFDWGARIKHAIYLRVWVAGRRRPIWLWVVGPGA